jgi:hypothetical protein
MSGKNSKSADIDRRAFFRRFLGQSAVLADEARGIRQLRLSDLPDLPHGLLREIIPVMLPEVELGSDEGRPILQYPQPQDGAARVELSEYEKQVFDQFTGWQSVARATTVLAATWQCDEEIAFERIRSSFLKWAAMGICHPRNPVG